MEFAQLIDYLGPENQDTPIYSVEDRNMLDHETEKRYFFTEQEAIHAAEVLWQQYDQSLRDDHEVSVHRGALEQAGGQPRFIVHQKLFKAYKKVYVSQQQAKAYLNSRKAHYQQSQAIDDQEAAALARQDLARQYAIQPKADYGMFAGYSYGPQDWTMFDPS